MHVSRFPNNLYLFLARTLYIQSRAARGTRINTYNAGHSPLSCLVILSAAVERL